MAILQAVWHNPHVVVLRDQNTIEALAKRLPGMRRVILVGNGGIALEVAHSLTGVEVLPLPCLVALPETANGPVLSGLLFRLLIQKPFSGNENATTGKDQTVIPLGAGIQPDSLSDQPVILCSLETLHQPCLICSRTLRPQLCCLPKNVEWKTGSPHKAVCQSELLHSASVFKSKLAAAVSAAGTGLSNFAVCDPALIE